MRVETDIDEAALSELASEVILMYPVGAEFRTEDVLAAHPDLAASRRSVIKLSFEEYCRRYDEQKDVDISDFVERFPGLESSLREQINVHSMLLKDEQQLARLLNPEWPQPDSRFLDWKLRRLIGKGGFSRVYLADEPKVGNRSIALKLTTRTGHECELIGRLHHPGICQILSVRDDGLSGVTAIAMPYHGDATLFDLIETKWEQQQTRASKELPDWGASQSRGFVDNIVQMAVKLCEALDYAHANQVLHCDLKPSNVLLKPDGSPILLDFNLAFSMRDGNCAFGGTLGYMAPEQIQATLERNNRVEIDVRTDVFGLGAVLYHLLGGSLAYQVDSNLADNDRLSAALTAIASAPPPPLRERNPAVAAELSALIALCLDADPRRRPQTIGEVRHALQKLTHAPAASPAASPNITVRRKSNHARIVVGILAMVAGSTAILVSRGGFDRTSTATSADPSVRSIHNEIAHLEAIPSDQISPAELELLAYYYLLLEEWPQAKSILSQLLADGHRNGRVLHNLTYCRIRLSEDQQAFQGFWDALDADPESGTTWAVLTYFDAMHAINDGRPPDPNCLMNARAHCQDDAMLDLLTRFVDGVDRLHDEPGNSTDAADSPATQALQAISQEFNDLPLSCRLIAPESLPSEPLSVSVAAR